MENGSLSDEYLTLNTILGEKQYRAKEFGPHVYTEAGKLILDAGLRLPTGDLTAPLIHAAYFEQLNSPDEKINNVRRIISNASIWVFNRNIWTDKGVYVVQDEHALGQDAKIDLEELEDLLSGGKNQKDVRFSQDGRVRFASIKSYCLGDQSPLSLNSDGFVIANYGIKGAEQLSEASKNFAYNCWTYGLEIMSDQKPQQRLNSICARHGWKNNRLDLVGDWGNYGYAFGIKN